MAGKRKPWHKPHAHLGAPLWAAVSHPVEWSFVSSERKNSDGRAEASLLPHSCLKNPMSLLSTGESWKQTMASVSGLDCPQDSYLDHGEQKYCVPPKCFSPVMCVLCCLGLGSLGGTLRGESENMGTSYQYKTGF